MKVITRQRNPFLKDDIYNLVIFAVAPTNVTSNTENRDRLGRQALEKFASARMTEKTEILGLSKEEQLVLLQKL